MLRPDVQALAQEGDITFCAAREAGYASEDAALLRAAFADASRFAQVADRLQQGAINSLMLGRLMIHPQGLVAAAGVPHADRRPGDRHLRASTTTRPRGGAFGGMVTALSPDAVRASLGTGGMNYNLMLPRSIDFKPFEAGFAKAYPSRLDRMLILSMLQGQWDRGETDGYAQNLTQDPLPNTPLHTLLFQAAVGDHQVPTVATEVEARTRRGRRPRPGVRRRPLGRPDPRLRPDRDEPARARLRAHDVGRRPGPRRRRLRDRRSRRPPTCR